MTGRRWWVKWQPLGPLAANCYLVGDQETGRGVVIDPGWEDPWLLRTIEETRLQVALIIATHGHFDHLGAVAALRRRLGAPFVAPRAEADFLATAAEQAEAFGLLITPPPPPDRLVEDGEELVVDCLRFQVLSPPATRQGACASI